MTLPSSSSSMPSCQQQKSLLLRAWRERWPDTQWSIHAKRLIIPQTADTLTDLLLQQALVGSSPNMLVLSYLRHAVSTQMVTFSSVIAYIIKYEEFGKIFCTRALLDLIENLSRRVSTVGNYEDSLEVCKSLLRLLLWLLRLIKVCIGKVSDDKMPAEYGGLVEKVAAILENFNGNKATVGLLYVAHLEDEETYDELKMVYCKVTGNMSKLSAYMSAESSNKLTEGLNIVNSISSMELSAEALVDGSHQPLNASLNVLLNIEAIIKSTNEIPPFVQQILIVESTQGLCRSRLYCELLRTSMAGMLDSAGGAEELRWAAFTFLKIPQILKHLVDQDESPNASTGLIEAFDMLLNYVPLLDLTDTKCGADCMHFLLNEVCNKYSLLTEAQCQTLTKRRTSESQKPPKSVEQQNSQPSASLILRAEHTVTSILKKFTEIFHDLSKATLDADYSKNQDALLGVLCHMMSGKSFELILAAAAATGKLQSFAIKLIKFNEFSKQTNGEASKGAQTRSLLFDISFLMLCHFTQLYGTEIVCSHPDSQSSFFLQWATRCLPEGGKYKSAELFTPADPAKVDALLSQFNPGGELKMNLTWWHDVCHNVPHAVQHVLNAWEHGTLTDAQVKTIIDNVKSRMCCLPVVVTAYLCSIINILDSDMRTKPLSFLAQLRQPMAQPEGGHNEYYTERSHLMSTIVSKVVQDVLPAEERLTTDHEIPSNQPAYTMLTQTFRAVCQRGCIDTTATHKMEHLLQLTGPKWFCQHLVMEVLSHDRPEELSRALGVTYALFSLEVESIVHSLLVDTIPSLLQATGSRLNRLTDPRGNALAQLTVMALVLLTKHKENKESSSSLNSIKRGRKRTLSQVSLEEKELGHEDGRPAKMRKQADETDDPFSFTTDSFGLPVISSSQKEQDGGTVKLDPAHKALVKLFRLLSAILSSGEVNERTGFVLSFMKQVLRSGSKNARYILQFMPLSMVSQLLMVMTDSSTPILLSLCDLSNPSGRSIAAKMLAQTSRSKRPVEKICGDLVLS